MRDQDPTHLTDDELESIIRSHMHSEFAKVPYDVLDTADEQVLEDADRTMPDDDRFDGDDIPVPML